MTPTNKLKESFIWDIYNAIMSEQIQISPKHGLNPSMLVCPICGKETGSIALMGKLEGDAEAPRYTYDREPCSECKEHISQGHRILIEVEDEGPIPDKMVTRTGRLMYITNKEALPDLVNPVSFCPKSLFNKLIPENDEQ